MNKRERSKQKVKKSEQRIGTKFTRFNARVTVILDIGKRLRIAGWTTQAVDMT
jgi:hypothetical protein